MNQVVQAGESGPLTADKLYDYCIGLLNMRDPKLGDEARTEVAKRRVERYKEGFKAMMKASGQFQTEEPLQRLTDYRRMSQDLWDEYRAKMPWLWQSDWRDFNALRQRALEGDFGPVEQTAEALLEAQNLLAQAAVAEAEAVLR